MAWIKRNLYFTIGGALAVVLMGLAGWYLYSQWDRNDQIFKELDTEYGELSTLNSQNPHPGGLGKVDNIKNAQEQRQELQDYIKKTRTFFQPIAPVPNQPRLTDHEFSEALSREISELQHEASSASVTLPPACCFSFNAQNKQLNFAPGSLPPLARQLGEVKALCEVLFQAKINSLESIRREVISTNDAAGELTDYLDQNQKSVTNDLAVLSPYELTFRCFSTELASVLAGYASSPNCIIVKGVSVESAPAEAAPGPNAVQNPQPVLMPQPIPQPPPRPSNADDEFSRRYGGSRRNPMPAPVPAYTLPQPASVASSLHGMPTVLDERELKVTLGLVIVKPLPPK